MSERSSSTIDITLRTILDKSSLSETKDALINVKDEIADTPISGMKEQLEKLRNAEIDSIIPNFGQEFATQVSVVSANVDRLLTLYDKIGKAQTKLDRQSAAESYVGAVSRASIAIGELQNALEASQKLKSTVPDSLAKELTNYYQSKNTDIRSAFRQASSPSKSGFTVANGKQLIDLVTKGFFEKSTSGFSADLTKFIQQHGTELSTALMPLMSTGFNREDLYDAFAGARREKPGSIRALLPEAFRKIPITQSPTYKKFSTSSTPLTEQEYADLERFVLSEQGLLEEFEQSGIAKRVNGRIKLGNNLTREHIHGLGGRLVSLFESGARGIAPRPEDDIVDVNDPAYLDRILAKNNIAMGNASRGMQVASEYFPWIKPKYTQTPKDFSWKKDIGKITANPRYKAGSFYLLPFEQGGEVSNIPVVNSLMQQKLSAIPGADPFVHNARNTNEIYVRMPVEELQDFETTEERRAELRSQIAKHIGEVKEYGGHRYRFTGFTGANAAFTREDLFNAVTDNGRDLSFFTNGEKRREFSSGAAFGKAVDYMSKQRTEGENIRDLYGTDLSKLRVVVADWKAITGADGQNLISSNLVPASFQGRDVSGKSTYFTFSEEGLRKEYANRIVQQAVQDYTEDGIKRGDLFVTARENEGTKDARTRRILVPSDSGAQVGDLYFDKGGINGGHLVLPRGTNVIEDLSNIKVLSQYDGMTQQELNEARTAELRDTGIFAKTTTAGAATPARYISSQAASSMSLTPRAREYFRNVYLERMRMLDDPDMVKELLFSGDDALSRAINSPGGEALLYSKEAQDIISQHRASITQSVAMGNLLLPQNAGKYAMLGAWLPDIFNALIPEDQLTAAQKAMSLGDKAGTEVQYDPNDPMSFIAHRVAYFKSAAENLFTMRNPDTASGNQGVKNLGADSFFQQLASDLGMDKEALYTNPASAILKKWQTADQDGDTVLSAPLIRSLKGTGTFGDIMMEVLAQTAQDYADMISISGRTPEEQAAFSKSRAIDLEEKDKVWSYDNPEDMAEWFIRRQMPGAKMGLAHAVTIGARQLPMNGLVARAIMNAEDHYDLDSNGLYKQWKEWNTTQDEWDVVKHGSPFYRLTEWRNKAITSPEGTGERQGFHNAVFDQNLFNKKNLDSINFSSIYDPHGIGADFDIFFGENMHPGSNNISVPGGDWESIFANMPEVSQIKEVAALQNRLRQLRLEKLQGKYLAFDDSLVNELQMLSKNAEAAITSSVMGRVDLNATEKALEIEKQFKAAGGHVPRHLKEWGLTRSNIEKNPELREEINKAINLYGEDRVFAKSGTEALPEMVFYSVLDLEKQHNMDLKKELEQTRQKELEKEAKQEEAVQQAEAIATTVPKVPSVSKSASEHTSGIHYPKKPSKSFGPGSATSEPDQSMTEVSKEAKDRIAELEKQIAESDKAIANLEALAAKEGEYNRLVSQAEDLITKIRVSAKGKENKIEGRSLAQGYFNQLFYGEAKPMLDALQQFSEENPELMKANPDWGAKFATLTARTKTGVYYDFADKAALYTKEFNDKIEKDYNKKLFPASSQKQKIDSYREQEQESQGFIDFINGMLTNPNIYLDQKTLDYLGKQRNFAQDKLLSAQKYIKLFTEQFTKENEENAVLEMEALQGKLGLRDMNSIDAQVRNRKNLIQSRRDELSKQHTEGFMSDKFYEEQIALLDGYDKQAEADIVKQNRLALGLDKETIQEKADKWAQKRIDTINASNRLEMNQMHDKWLSGEASYQDYVAAQKKYYYGVSDEEKKKINEQALAIATIDEELRNEQQQNVKENLVDQGDIRVRNMRHQFDQQNLQQRMRYSRSRIAQGLYGLEQRRDAKQQEILSIEDQQRAVQRQQDFYAKELEKAKKTGNQELIDKAQFKYDESTQQLENLGKASTEAKAELDQLNQTGQSVQAVFGAFSQTIGMVAQRLGRQLFQKAIQEAKQFVKQFDASMNEIQAITLKSNDEMAGIRSQTIEKAIGLRTSVSNVAGVEAALYRQGLSDAEVSARTESIIKFATVTKLNVQEATKIITTALQNDLVNSANEAMDALVALGDSAATTAAEIGKGMQKSAAAAKVAGVSYAELTALLTIGTSDTQLSGTQVGTALQTVFTRMRRLSLNKWVSDQNGETTTANDAEAALASVGVDLWDNKTLGTMRSAYDILRDLSEVWQDLSDAQKNIVMNSMAGTRQTNVFATLMEGMSEDGGATLDKYLGLAEGSEGITQTKYEIAMQSLAAAMDELKSSWDAVVESFVNSGSITGVLDGFSQFLQYVSNASSIGQGLSVIAAGITGIAVACAAAKASLGPISTLLGLLAGVVAGGTILSISSLFSNDGLTESERLGQQSIVDSQVNEAKKENRESKLTQAKKTIDEVKKLGEEYNKAQTTENEDKLTIGLEKLAAAFPAVSSAILNAIQDLSNWEDAVESAEKTGEKYLEKNNRETIAAAKRHMETYAQNDYEIAIGKLSSPESKDKAIEGFIEYNSRVFPYSQFVSDDIIDYNEIRKTDPAAKAKMLYDTYWNNKDFNKYVESYLKSTNENALSYIKQKRGDKDAEAMPILASAMDSILDDLSSSNVIDSTVNALQQEIEKGNSVPGWMNDVINSDGTINYDVFDNMDFDKKAFMFKTAYNNSPELQERVSVIEALRFNKYKGDQKSYMSLPKILGGNAKSYRESDHTELANIFSDIIDEGRVSGYASELRQASVAFSQDLIKKLPLDITATDQYDRDFIEKTLLNGFAIELSKNKEKYYDSNNHLQIDSVVNYLSNFLDMWAEDPSFLQEYIDKYAPDDAWSYFINRGKENEQRFTSKEAAEKYATEHNISYAEITNGNGTTTYQTVDQLIEAKRIQANANNAVRDLQTVLYGKETEYTRKLSAGEVRKLAQEEAGAKLDYETDAEYEARIAQAYQEIEKANTGIASKGFGGVRSFGNFKDLKRAYALADADALLANVIGSNAGALFGWLNGDYETFASALENAEPGKATNASVAAEYGNIMRLLSESPDRINALRTDEDLAEEYKALQSFFGENTDAILNSMLAGTYKGSEFEKLVTNTLASKGMAPATGTRKYTNVQVADLANKVLSRNYSSLAAAQTGVTTAGWSTDSWNAMMSKYPELEEYLQLDEQQRKSQYGQNLLTNLQIKISVAGISDLEEANKVLEGTTSLIESLQKGGSFALKGKLEFESGLHQLQQQRAVLENGTEEEQIQQIAALTKRSTAEVQQDFEGSKALALQLISGEEALIPVTLNEIAKQNPEYAAELASKNGYIKNPNEGLAWLQKQYPSAKYEYDAATGNISWFNSNTGKREISRSDYTQRELEENSGYIDAVDYFNEQYSSARHSNKKIDIEKRASEYGLVLDENGKFKRKPGQIDRENPYLTAEELLTGSEILNQQREIIENGLMTEPEYKTSRSKLGEQGQEYLRMLANQDKYTQEQLDAQKAKATAEIEAQSEGAVQEDLQKEYSLSSSRYIREHASEIAQNRIKYSTGTSADRLSMLSTFGTSMRGISGAQYAIENFNSPESASTLASFLSMDEKDVREAMKTETGKQELQDAINQRAKETFAQLAEEVGADMSGFNLETDSLSDLRSTIEAAANEATGETREFLLKLASSISEAGSVIGQTEATFVQDYDKAMQEFAAAGETREAYDWLRENAATAMADRQTYTRRDKYGKNYDYTETAAEALQRNANEAGIKLNGIDVNQFASTSQLLQSGAIDQEQFAQILDYIQNGTWTSGASSALTTGLFGSEFTNENGTFKLPTDTEGASAFIDKLQQLHSETSGLSEALKILTSQYPELERLLNISQSDTAESLEQVEDVLKDVNTEMETSSNTTLKKYGDDTETVNTKLKSLRGTTKQANSELKTMTSNLSTASDNQYYREKWKKGDRSSSTKESIASQLGLSNKKELSKLSNEQIQARLDKLEISDIEEIQVDANAVSESMTKTLQNALNGNPITLNGAPVTVDSGPVSLSFDEALSQLSEYLTEEEAAFLELLESYNIEGTVVVNDTGEGLETHIEITGLGTGTKGGSSSGGGGGESEASKLNKKLNHYITEKKHAVTLLETEEESLSFMNDFDAWSSNLDAQIAAQNELAEQYKSNIAELKSELSSVEEYSDDWYTLTEAIMDAEEALAEVNNQINSINAKRITLLEEKHEIEDKPGTHKQTILSNYAALYQTNDNFESYKSAMEKYIYETQSQIDLNDKQIKEWEDLLTTMVKGSDNWNDIRDKIWALKEENAELMNEVASDTIELHKAEIAQIAADLDEENRAAAHANEMLDIYSSIYEATSNYAEYRESLRTTMQNNQQMKAATDEAIEEIKQQIEEMKEEDINDPAIQTAIETLNQLELTSLQYEYDAITNRKAIEESLINELSTKYKDQDDIIEHEKKLLDAAEKSAIRDRNYEQQINILQEKSRNIKDDLDNQTEALAAYLELQSSGKITEGSQEWRELEELIRQTEESVADLGNEWQESIDKINTTSFENAKKEFDDINSYFEHELKLVQYQQTSYKNKGELTNLGTSYEWERALKESERDQIQKNIEYYSQQLEMIEDQPDLYEKVDKELRKQEEDLAKINNELDQIDENIKKNEEDIRKALTTVEKEVDKYFRERDQKEKNMLNATISLENTLANVIKKNYQDEWNLIKKTIQKQKEALNEQKALLNERLNAKKNALNQEDKIEELSRLKQQLALIQADSTRTKDAKELAKQIEDIEKELAWNIADENLAAQTQMIDDQIKALDEYTAKEEEDLNERLQNYETFRDKIDEILSGTFEDFVAFMAADDEEYKNASAERRQQMEESWRDTWRTMQDELVTYWDEDEFKEIMSSKDNFLAAMMQRDEYRKESETGQASLIYKWEEFYDKWQKSLISNATFEDLYDEQHKVIDTIEGIKDWTFNVRVIGSEDYTIGTGYSDYIYERDKTLHEDYDLNDDYAKVGLDKPTTSGNGGSGGGSGGSSGSGSGSGGGSTTPVAKKYGYQFTYNGQKYTSGRVYSSASKAISDGESARSGVARAERNLIGLQYPNGGTQYDYWMQVIGARERAATVTAYKMGGLVDYTGPAWVDGTKTRPESFLDATDTEILRGMLDEFRFIRTSPYMTTIDSSNFSNSGVSVGDININLYEAKLENDADYNEIARKVGKAFTKELQKDGFNLAGYAW